MSAPGTNYLNAKKGLASWLLTVDHKRIGLMYLVAILFFFSLGGFYALKIRTELATSGPDLMTGKEYNISMTLHGAIMVFLVLVPSIPASIGNFVLPMMLGAKDVAFPKLNLLSFWIYVLGACSFVLTLIMGGVDTGWTFYTPYSSTTDTAVISALSGAFILGFSSILTGINFMVTVHKMRAPGLTWGRLPLMIWALYSTSVIQILATPVIAITLALLMMEKMFRIGIFDPALGGDPVLFQHFFWFYSHPVVYVMILPAFGVISETVSVHSRKRIFGYTAIAASSVSIAAISFIVWGHHMFVSGQSAVAGTVFSMLTFGVAVPTAIKVCSWIATMWKGSIRFNGPMNYTQAFLFIFTIGGLTGLFLSTIATDVHLHDTYFVVAHFHYVMMGGTLMGFIAALHHWFPLITGRIYNEKLAAIGCLTVFTGFNLTFFSQFILGTNGMPRRYHEYLPIFEPWHQVSTAGAYILGTGLTLTLFYLIQGALKGERVGKNHWQCKTLEWEAECPPIEHNFEGQPICTTGPYDFDELDLSLENHHGKGAA